MDITIEEAKASIGDMIEMRKSSGADETSIIPFLYSQREEWKANSEMKSFIGNLISHHEQQFLNGYRLNTYTKDGLEDIITKVLNILIQGKAGEAQLLLEIANKQINESYERYDRR